MSKVENEGVVELEEGRLEELSGGPAYIKFDGIDGRVTASTAKPIQLDATGVFGDGSVRSIGN